MGPCFLGHMVFTNLMVKKKSHHNTIYFAKLKFWFLHFGLILVLVPTFLNNLF